MTSEPTSTTKRAIVQQDIQAWQNTLYQARVRHRVQSLIGSGPDMLKNLEAEMERAVKAIDSYNVILEEVEAEIAKTDGKESDDAGPEY
jgi:hypothetical protein